MSYLQRVSETDTFIEITDGKPTDFSVALQGILKTSLSDIDKY